MKKLISGNLFLLHLIVFIYGFTAILGKLISIGSGQLVWWRMVIAAVVIAAYSYSQGKIKKSLLERGWLYAIVGLIIAAHWITFFEAIKVSNVSVTLACLSASALFTALIEPLLFRRKVDPFELIFGAMVVAGLLLIFRFETDYTWGITLALISAFLASAFNTTNGLLIRKDNPYRISLVEMIGGVIGISAYLIYRGQFNAGLFEVPVLDWVWLLILGVICTAFAFVVGVKVMEELTPFTVSLTINLEPVYGIILAYLIFDDSERMSPQFYVGTVIIMASLYLNALRRKRLKRKETISAIPGLE